MKAAWILLACPSIWAQGSLFDKAPPAVDQALRDHIQKFYQAHVDGKFRQADKFVAEDSKDYFFAAEKRKFRSCGLVSVTYSENFTRATATVACESDFMFHGDTVPVTMPLSSLWKIEDGEWHWYVVPKTEMVTPFGIMKPGAVGKTPAPMIPKDPLLAAQQLLSKVKVDKTASRLSSYEKSADDITVTNGMPGPIEVRVEFTPYPGFSVQTLKPKLGAGESTVVRLMNNPKDRSPKPTQTIHIRIDPTSQDFPVEVTFSLPPEIEQKLPPSLRPK